MATYAAKSDGREVRAHKWDGDVDNVPTWAASCVIQWGNGPFVQTDYNGLRRELRWPLGRYLVEYPWGIEVVRAEDFEKVYRLKEDNSDERN